MKFDNERMGKQVLFGLAVVFVVISMFGFVGAEMLVSDAGVGYESEILEEFVKIENNETDETFVKIIITLENKSEANNIFSNFSEDQLFNIINHPTSEDISARITEDGFYKLIQDDRIEKVYFNRQLYFAEAKEVYEETEVNESQEETNEFEDTKYNWILWLGSIVIILIIIWIIIKRNK